ncbi:hypothetical protein GCM10027295_08120 [Pseudaeromonas pectinilytica]
MACGSQPVERIPVCGAFPTVGIHPGPPPFAGGEQNGNVCKAETDQVVPADDAGDIFASFTRNTLGFAQLSPTDYQLPIRYQPGAAGRAEGGTRPSQWPSGSAGAADGRHDQLRVIKSGS